MGATFHVNRLITYLGIDVLLVLDRMNGIDKIHHFILSLLILFQYFIRSLGVAIFSRPTSFLQKSSGKS